MWRIRRQCWLLLARVGPALKLRFSGVLFLAAALSTLRGILPRICSLVSGAHGLGLALPCPGLSAGCSAVTLSVTLSPSIAILADRLLIVFLRGRSHCILHMASLESTMRRSTGVAPRGTILVCCGSGKGWLMVIWTKAGWRLHTLSWT